MPSKPFVPSTFAVAEARAPHAAESITRRAALVGAIASSAVAAVPALAFAAENGDAVLSRLYSEYSALREPEERAWEAADPLVDAGVKEAKRQGIVNFDREWDRYFAIHIAVGARAAEQAADEISQRRAQLLEEIRATRPATVRGLAVKLEAMRQVVCIQDEGPREDQDWDHEFFNIFGDDLRSLIT